MIINHLSFILNEYKKTKNENFVLSQNFLEYFNNTLTNLDSHKFLFALAYEAKDFGESIVNSEYTNKIFSFFDESLKHYNNNNSVYNYEFLLLHYLAKGIFCKYFVYSSKEEYLNLYMNLKKLNYTSDDIYNVFKNSLEKLYDSISNINMVFQTIEFTNAHAFYHECLRKELTESYSLLTKLGIEDSEPNIDSSYVFLDQVNNLDFFNIFSKNLFEWCVNNVK